MSVRRKCISSTDGSSSIRVGLRRLTTEWGGGLTAISTTTSCTASRLRSTSCCNATVYQHLQRIRQYNPAMKLIVLLRDPVDRAFSQWSMLRMNGRDVPAFEEIVATVLTTGMHKHEIIRRGEYGRLAYNLMSLFPDDQICCARRRPQPSDAGEFGFLGGKPHAYESTWAYATDTNPRSLGKIPPRSFGRITAATSRSSNG